MAIREVELIEVRRTYFATKGRSNRKQIVEDAARRYGISYSQMIRDLDLRVRAKSDPKPELLAKKNEINHWATQIFDFAKEMTKDEKRILINKSYKFYQKHRGLPEHITLRNVYDAIEELKLKNRSEHCPGHMRAEYARKMYQMDFTPSRYFKHIGNGILKLTNDRYSRKHKDEDGNLVKLWIGGVIDDHSNVIYYEYMLTLGESAIAAQELVLNAFRRKEGRAILQGLPEMMYLDRGPGFQDQGFMAGLEGIGVSVKFGDDIIDRRTGKRTNQTNKGAHGKIERMHAILKNDFEQELLLGLIDGCDLKLGSHIAITELNQILWKWIAEYNNSDTHPEYKGMNKWELFAEKLDDTCFLPDDCASFFVHTVQRVVTQHRIQMGANKFYQVPDEIDNGTTIDVITLGGQHYTLDKDGKRIHLPPVKGVVGHVEYKQKAEAERKSDLLTDRETVRERFDQELKKRTGGAITLFDLDDVIYITMCKDFLDQPHTIEEIKSRAEYIALRATEQLREAMIAEQQESGIGNDHRGHGVRGTGGARIITMPGS